ncbi:MAG: valine--tRNA ligase [Candidatus Blackburnbacteria bacterium]|nr:valine--tRNA ligase [Candidatus Blackburnbacteria bacterium]
MNNNQQQLNKEKEIYEAWEASRLFRANPESDKPRYSLLMPPPNLTGDLHLGHAMQHAILDALARYKRMQGYDVLLLPGVDHAGIQFEGTFNKILEKEGLSKHKLGREEWLKRAWKFKDEVYKSFHNTWTVLGISADWLREVFTFEPKIQKAVFTEFKTFWEQGLLYKGAYIVQWCPKCGTAIEDVEMEYLEKEEKLYFVRYQIEQSQAEGDCVVIATARPETIYADTGIAVYPNHPKYAQFIGKKAKNPLTGEYVPIFEDERVDPEFGTGALKITPGHDPLDYQIGKDHNLPILHAIDKTGRTTELAQDLSGLKIEEAREKAAQKLESLDALEKVENYTHSVPICERCKTTVEPLISEEWFIKMEPLAKKALEHIGEINFYPENYQKILTDWLENIHDWCISRSLWWGHRIPVWYCIKCNHGKLVGKDKEIMVSFEEPTRECTSCGKKHWAQDEQVFDTWFSSGMWPITTLGWPWLDETEGEGGPEKSKDFKAYFPWDFEITAPEIKYLWIARMIMLSLWFKDEIPFKHMFFHGMLRPLTGAKFSKSLGNAVYPNELRDAWGTDSVRMTLYTYAAPGRDSRTSKQLMDERAKNFRNFGNKLRNIARFIVDLRPNGVTLRQSAERSLAHASPGEPGTSVHAPTAEILSQVPSGNLAQNDNLHQDDMWILEELEKTTQEVTKNIEGFQLHLATEELYDFIWHKFADVYIENSKSRREGAQPTLEYVLDSILRLLHPFIPFLTEELWLEKLEKSESIMLAPWPTPQE